MLKIKKGDVGFGVILEVRFKKLVINELTPIIGVEDNEVAVNNDVDNHWNLDKSTAWGALKSWVKLKLYG